jgi:hypothetical protein
MKIDLFSEYHGIMISANDFMIFFSTRSLIIAASIALVIVGFRRVRKVRNAR